MTRLVLGSASSGRLKVLQQAGVDPLVVVSGVDEDAIMAGLGPAATPADVVRVLARAKAEQVATTLTGQQASVATDCLVIGCDSMLYIDGRLCGKPETVDDARQLWRSMAGRCGHLYTGHSVVRLTEQRVTHRDDETSTTTVHFATPSDDDLEAYLATGESLKVAGGFTLDGLGGWFITGVEGDPSAVVGIGLPLTRDLISRAGISIAALWASNPLP
ncbi:nucleotide-binding protein [Mycobacterium marinum M]|uniref:Nucleoside triphosphate pyrophosphatase n=1 Tax=Mycobacterium marinum (strain ATCC BAA-535 / M) TaxID=216594 RepID=NTPP_MYCMM|nr:nucleoside triphosphate pyrophosphatase [Mycobacterium marinum]B2HEK5.1 RecName: Full=Nucleoside triphosphate pyrophosphatase; AltName: Full=Nucleotide pyrophosphatase; Short=Nucleotide PPase [Mycobacterium marinum M]ACC39712.1 nucleotide-binding protein [Mycobacterium marinum M]GJO32259.1 Maf-like protein [Mycobacterium marinum]